MFARFLRRTKKRGAGVLRQRVEGLQGGLEQLSTGLEELEKGPKTATAKRRSRPPATRRPAARPRKPKKAA